MNIKTVGIIGAGKLGIVLAQLALKAGYKVYISGSGEVRNIKLTVDALAPGAAAATNKEVAEHADVIILALPLGKFRQIPRDLFAGKLVIDATNHWWEVDGPRSDIVPDELSTGEAVRNYFSEARVVKALSHMGYHHLHDEARPKSAAGRKAIAVAGDDNEDVMIVGRLVDAFGFDPVYIDTLAKGRHLEPGSPAFGANVDAATLNQLIQSKPA